MGDPKKPRKKYTTPKMPWRSDQLSQELYLVGTYGLRNKHELWKAHTELSKMRKQARTLLAEPPEIRVEVEKKLLSSLSRRGIITDKKVSVDDVLVLTIENLLERRLQTIVWRKGITVSPYQARQMINHKHIMVGDRIVTRPGYMVKRDEEEGVRLSESSPFRKQMVST
ncbi:MAG: 30S ribosomal protein S4 [archaeon]|nr:30S ribosomal protein S4 [archaeon]MCP8305959.1 30S ribosomal protein S4 [archaeon]